MASCYRALWSSVVICCYGVPQRSDKNSVLPYATNALKIFKKSATTTSSYL